MVESPYCMYFHILGGIFDSSVLVFNCRFDLQAELANTKSAQAKSAKRFLNATYTMSDKVTNNFFISVERNSDSITRVASDTVDVKLLSPNLVSGVSMSFNTSKNTGDDLSESSLLVSGYGLNEKFTFSYDHLATAEGAVKKIDLKSSLAFVSHAHLDMENKKQVLSHQKSYDCP